MSGKASPADPAKYIKPEDGPNANGDDAPQDEPIVKFSPEEEAVSHAVHLPNCSTYTVP